MPEKTSEVNGFFLHLSQCKALFNLPPESAMEALKMCHDYCEGKTPESSDPIAICTFGLMRPALDKSLTRAVSGRKGGKANCKQIEANASKLEADESKTKQNEANNKQTQANVSQEIKNKEQEINNTPPTPPTGGDGSDSTSKKSRSRCSDDYDADFLAFWDKYPRKVSKGAAWKAYSAKRKNGRLPPDLLERLANKCLCDQWRKDDGQYIPHPATWLNREGWEDEDCTPPAEESYAAGWEEELDKLYEIGKRCEVGIFDSDEERARKNEIYKQEYEPMWADMRRRGCRAI